MKIRNKKTGELVDAWSFYDGNESVNLKYFTDDGQVNLEYNSLAELNDEWEDYEPVEPIFDEKIRNGIRAWWDMQDNPFKAASVYCDKKKDLDGFYHWRIFGYIREGDQKESTDLCFRTKKLYEFKYFKDYTKQELCGEEEE